MKYTVDIENSRVVEYYENPEHFVSCKSGKSYPFLPEHTEYFRNLVGKELVEGVDFEISPCCDMQCDGTCEQTKASLYAIPIEQKDEWEEAERLFNEQNPDCTPPPNYTKFINNKRKENEYGYYTVK